jgi:hypothetical protein
MDAWAYWEGSDGEPIPIAGEWVKLPDGRYRRGVLVDGRLCALEDAPWFGNLQRDPLSQRRGCRRGCDPQP